MRDPSLRPSEHLEIREVCRDDESTQAGATGRCDGKDAGAMEGAQACVMGVPEAARADLDQRRRGQLHEGRDLGRGEAVGA